MTGALALWENYLNFSASSLENIIADHRDVLSQDDRIAMLLALIDHLEVLGRIGRSLEAVAT